MVLRLCALAFLAIGCLLYGGNGVALAGDYDGGYGQAGDEATQPDAAGDDEAQPDDGDAPDDEAPADDQPE